jgi:hypothetical protein
MPQHPPPPGPRVYGTPTIIDEIQIWKLTVPR